MIRFTAASQHALAWFAAWWPRRVHHDLAGQYRAMLKAYPLPAADMARFGLAFDSTFHRNPRQSDLNQGKREFWLHIEAMAAVTGEELETLRKETENVEQ